MTTLLAAAFAAALQCNAGALPATVHVAGSVVDAGTLKPLPNASVRLLGAASCGQLSDRHGRFRMPAMSPGKYVVEVAFLGYQTARDSILVGPDASLDLTVKLSQTAIEVAPITVTVRSQFLDRNGFYDRRASGAGAFLTHADIARMNGIAYASDVLRSVRGVRVLARRGQHGGNMVVDRASCPFRYYVDGVKTDPQFEFDDLEPQYIEALEIYSGLGQIPAEYSSGSGIRTHQTCGVVVVWTRQRH